jgi:hypothetical protein
LWLEELRKLEIFNDLSAIRTLDIPLVQYVNQLRYRMPLGFIF